jgi:long-subunit fatty acid transport protein
VNLGLVAKTRMKADVDLTRSRVDFTTNPGGPDIITTNSYRSSTVDLDLPGAIGFGASWRPTSPLTLSADYTHTYWSRARVLNFFTLPPGVETLEPQLPEVFASLPFPTVVDQAQSDTKELRLGVEYVVIPGRVKLPLRAGYFRAQQYRLVQGQPPRHNGLTAGAGFLLGPVALDAAYVYQWTAYDEGANEAGANIRSSVRLHSVLLSIIYRHGAR